MSATARPTLDQELKAKVDELRQSLNFADECEKQGLAYSEADSEGNVIEHPGR